MLELGWLDPLKTVLGVVHLPLTALLIAAGIYFWRRGPERNERWDPSESIPQPSVQPAVAAGRLADPQPETNLFSKMFGRKVVRIDNSSPRDNYLTNASGIPVSVACTEMYGHFAVNLQPGESKRVTYDVQANVYPHGEYSYDNLDYRFGRGETWEVRSSSGKLILVKVRG